MRMEVPLAVWTVAWAGKHLAEEEPESVAPQDQVPVPPETMPQSLLQVSAPPVGQVKSVAGVEREQVPAAQSVAAETPGDCSENELQNPV